MLVLLQFAGLSKQKNDLLLSFVASESLCFVILKTDGVELKPSVQLEGCSEITLRSFFLCVHLEASKVGREKAVFFSAEPHRHTRRS